MEGNHSLLRLVLHLGSRAQGAPRSTPLLCEDPTNCRTTWDITWSCLVTIFSCTWLAIHPNVPHPSDSMTRVYLRRLQTVLMALIAPELIILWAARQWIFANKLSKKFCKYGWTQTHGFFALMGGFMLWSDYRPSKIVTPYTLAPHELEKYILRGDIDITEEEIQDRSKGDILTKGLILLQSGWFIIQFVARCIEQLPSTELEVLTIAFAVLSIGTYGLWWNKPLNVQCAVNVRKTRYPHHNRYSDGEAEMLLPTHLYFFTNRGGKAESAAKFRQSINSDSFREVAEVEGHDRIRRVWNAMQATRRRTADFVARKSKQTNTYFQTSSPRRVLLDTVLFIPTALWAFCITPFMWVIQGHRATLWSGSERGMKVPTFYYGDLDRKERWYAVLAAVSSAVAFGVLHFLAWSFHFASSSERLLWRISVVVVACTPALLALMIFCAFAVDRKLMSALPPRVYQCLGTLLVFFSALAVCLYVAARVLLIVLAFSSLRSLPPGVHSTVNWTTFIPHI
ncbi:hypothetical protein Hypma_004303 [Hypsizygus marmoreus]|uniref:Uncharacterized protein n=1 Tax=Hypsizygus marmoreus TaxID=39966 RepID=A0A369JYJ3_HYPMA|nr:hypothetical protein Hypma_004303 [Hypsizygus marmoreus]